MGGINILYGGKGETFHFCLWAEAQPTQKKTSELYWRFFSFDLIYFVDILGGGVPGAGEQLVGFMSLLPSYGF